jgi:hypothetical protein
MTFSLLEGGLIVNKREQDTEKLKSRVRLSHDKRAEEKRKCVEEEAYRLYDKYKKKYKKRNEFWRGK